MLGGTRRKGGGLSAVRDRARLGAGGETIAVRHRAHPPRRLALERIDPLQDLEGESEVDRRETVHADRLRPAALTAGCARPRPPCRLSGQGRDRLSLYDADSRVECEVAWGLPLQLADEFVDG